MLNIFVGFDARQPVAPCVLMHSIYTRASSPVAITPLVINQLPIKRTGMTCFTFSRFLVPHLSGYNGFSMFLDADMLCLGDVVELMNIASQNEADVSVIKNQRRFEWPSLMVFNNERCKILTPEFVDNEKNSLYDLAWASSVGSLPAEWNHLEGYDPPNPNPKLIHFTMGIPCWPETRKSEHADLWHKELKAANSTVSFEALMGKSVHVQHLGKLAAA